MIDDIRAKLKMAKDANENFRPIPDEALIYDVEIRALLDQHDADQRALAARDDRIAALVAALQFYANLANWPGEPETDFVYGWYMGTAIDADFGAQARAALSSHDD